MVVHQGRGDFIGGRFVPAPSGWAKLVSYDPARDFAEVYSGAADEAHAADAIAAANEAQRAWASLPQTARNDALFRLKDAFDARVTEMARVITHETGKPHREAIGEAKALGARITLMVEHGLDRVAPLMPHGRAGRRARTSPRRAGGARPLQLPGASSERARHPVITHRQHCRR